MGVRRIGRRNVYCGKGRIGITCLGYYILNRRLRKIRQICIIVYIISDVVLATEVEAVYCEARIGIGIELLKVACAFSCQRLAILVYIYKAYVS